MIKTCVFWTFFVLAGVATFCCCEYNRVQDVARQNDKIQTELAVEGNAGKVIGVYYEHDEIRHTIAVVELKSKRRIAIEITDSLPVVGETWEISFDTAYHFVKPQQ